MDMSQLIPGANSSGSNQNVPTPSSNNTPAIGGGSNPFLTSFPSGTNTPPIDSTINQAGPDANMGPPGGGAVSMNGLPGMATTNPAAGGGNNNLNSIIQAILSGGFPANGVAPGQFGGGAGGGAGSNQFGSNFNLAQSLGLGSGDPNAAHDFVKAMRKAGISAGVAGQLWNFINSGAGFNQGAINNMLSSTFAAEQPQIQRNENDLLEHFGAMGLGMSSPAAIGLGDYLSQVSLGQEKLAGEIEFAQYNQAVQNYLSVLMGGKGPAPNSMFQNIIQWLQAAGSAAGGAGQLAAGLG